MPEPAELAYVTAVLVDGSEVALARRHGGDPEIILRRYDDPTAVSWLWLEATDGSWVAMRHIMRLKPWKPF